MITAEKRADAIIRWLERMKKSYRTGAVETALMDAECARADFEDLRAKIFSGLQKRKGVRENGKLFSAITIFPRILILSMLVVMLSVTPLARDILPKTQESISEREERAVKRAEVTGKREEKTESRAVKTKTSAHVRPKKKTVSPPKKLSAYVQPVKTAKKAKTVPHDRLYTLIETGRRALKNNTAVIVK